MQSGGEKFDGALLEYALKRGKQASSFDFRKQLGQWLAAYFRCGSRCDLFEPRVPSADNEMTIGGEDPGL